MLGQERLLQAAVREVVGLQCVIRGVVARRGFQNRLRLEKARVAAKAKAEAERERERLRVVAKVEERERLRVVAAQEERARRLAREESDRVAEVERLARLHAAKEEAAAEQARLEAQELEQQSQIRRFANSTVIHLQAHIRGALTRQAFDQRITSLDHHEQSILHLQAVIRGRLFRRAFQAKLMKVLSLSGEITSLQSLIRGELGRRRLWDRIKELRSMEPPLVGLQALIRAHQSRQRYSRLVHHLRNVSVVRGVGGLQSLARAALVRRRVAVERKELGFIEPDLVGLQAQIRGQLARRRHWNWIQHVALHEDRVVGLQSLLRGGLVRRRQRGIYLHLQQQMNSVIHLQALIRSRRQINSYNQLIHGTQVPLSTIKNFLRLLDDSDHDFLLELSLEKLRKDVISGIRENEHREEEVKELDRKIALLVKNQITHQVAKSSSSSSRGVGGAGGGLSVARRNQLLIEVKDPFAPEVKDAQTLKRLERYQMMFWILQTQPEYLSRWLATLSSPASVVGGLTEREKVLKSVEQVVFGLFGFAQGRREEFLLLKLFQVSTLCLGSWLISHADHFDLDSDRLKNRCRIYLLLRIFLEQISPFCDS